MSSRRRPRSARRAPSENRDGEGKKCIDCKKYSRNTFYCAREHKVLDQGREACVAFAPRQAHRGRLRKF